MNARKQRGAAFYLFIVFVLGSFAAAALFINRPTDITVWHQQKATMALRDARDHVVAHLASPDLNSFTGRLGQFATFPDLPIAAGSGLDASEPNLDGLGETTGCAYRGWSNGQALRPAPVSGAAARCFGQLPWRLLGLVTESADTTDAPGDIPWLIASPNLLTSASCLPDLNPMMDSGVFSGYNCPSLQPYPWISVRDDRGNLLSDRVAFALVLPGPPLPGQSRGSGADISDYLDTVTVSATCAAPCQPGTYNNADYDHADNQPWVLIQANTSSPLATSTQLYQTPVHFNDRLIFVTIDELFSQLQGRALGLTRSWLQRYATINGHYPFASPIDSATGACATGNRFGHLPATDGSCGSGAGLGLPNLLTASGWHRYFVYAVSPRCVSGAAFCNPPGLTIDASNDVNAILFAPNRPVTSAPYTASRSGVQRPLTAVGILSTNAADWLDHPENSGVIADLFVTPGNGASPDNDRLIRLN